MVSKSVTLLLLILSCKCFVANNLKLKQVFMLGRHNIRYPLGEKLPRYSAKLWPQPDGQPGLLTPKGAQLEGYMGEYFAEWFENEEFFPEGCPDEDTVYVYANTANRTKGTARSFIDSVFKNCNVTVHHHKNITIPDPLFKPVIHNTTEAYKEMVIKEITRKMQNNPKLNAGLLELNKVLDIEGSDVCKQDGICDLTGDHNVITYKVGEKVWISGPLFIGVSCIDSFIMNYYDGKPMEDIAWGQITTPEKWKLLTEIWRQNHYIKYSSIADDIAAPLMEYITNTFKNYDEMPKLILMVGHDYSLNSVAISMGFKLIELPNQYENYPIGGKMVFQRWTDGENDFLKVEYVYPSWLQLRDGSKYSLDSPPQRVVMRLNWCNTDEQGFCPWQEFVNKL